MTIREIAEAIDDLEVKVEDLESEVVRQANEIDDYHYQTSMGDSDASD
ncbi:hypothetical protein CcrC1_gp100 [Caulobacter phage C1]|nr:hypothetical protein CcrC1_gp100 [Caulobacter phage C1]UTU08328.1 hypothetical protein CcrC2_gp100 [Caulobacter phage C2]UTU08848.1 hypothetical protein CcrJ4_gp097 [Caulobacter phage J4]UTU09402.1 hypothetical protein CcrBL47_gp116 [Caulobacter phage BL47]UTU09962.1 hypothetical protein CcrRB23_gp100 [Caulobacter phage RB23]WGN96987.1 hypothetical protein [Bertelyvirus sp.]